MFSIEISTRRDAFSDWKIYFIGFSCAKRQYNVYQTFGREKTHVAMHQNPWIACKQSESQFKTYREYRICCKVCYFTSVAIIQRQKKERQCKQVAQHCFMFVTVNIKTNHTTKTMHHVNAPLKNNSKFLLFYGEFTLKTMRFSKWKSFWAS